MRLSRGVLLLFITVGGIALLSFLLGIIGYVNNRPAGRVETKVESSGGELSTKEESLPEATPQALRTKTGEFTTSTTSQDTGSLIVTANIQRAWVTIDQREEAAAEGKRRVDESVKVAPTQYTPFTIEKIPVGKHTLIGSKPGYVAQTIEFEIKKDTVTKIQLQLRPN